MPPAQQEPASARKVFTIGHSNRSLEAFPALLDAFGLVAVADVRRCRGSCQKSTWSRMSNRSASSSMPRQTTGTPRPPTSSTWVWI